MARKGFIYDKEDLLIPNPKENPEAYQKALGNRPIKERKDSSLSQLQREMSITQILFWVLSTLALFSALMVVTSKNPVFSVIWLIITFLPFPDIIFY